MKEWEELDADVWEANRELIRVLPAALADAGQQIVREDGPVARAIHARYLGERQRWESPGAGDLSVVPWSELDESLRASCRDQAAHIPIKLRMLDCAVGPQAAAVPFRPSEDEVEILARMEHERWVAQREADGWTYGERDPAQRRSPHLISWEQLDEETREWDRLFVRQIPDLLAAGGLGVVARPRAQ
jgi:hypothetical protein